MNHVCDSILQELPEDITAEMLDRIYQICDENRGRPGALIPVLQACQEVAGYLPPPLLEVIAQRLGVPGQEVFGVATFYSFFSLEPRGKHTCRVCMGTACYVRGGKEVLERLERHLETKVDTTTDDRRFTLEQVRCLGACGVAPVVVIDQDTHRKVMADAIVDIVEQYQ